MFETIAGVVVRLILSVLSVGVVLPDLLGSTFWMLRMGTPLRSVVATKDFTCLPVKLPLDYLVFTSKLTIGSGLLIYPIPPGLPIELKPF